MRKITSLLMLFLCCVGMAWGQRVVTSVNTEKYYQLKCQATDDVHGNGANVWFADLGTAFAGKNATPTFFKFVEAATEGKYYIYSVASGKYVNVDNTALVQGETATTEWTVGTINDAGYVYISSSDKNYLNNAGGTNSIQIKNHSSGVSSGNPCSLWTLTEYDVTIESEGSTTATWATTSWSVIDDIPDEIKNIESRQYATAESDIQATSREVTVPAGYLISEIIYSGGDNRLDILGVDLLNSEGEVIATDYRFGYSGGARLNNAHRFKVEAGTYTIRYWVTFCTEANVSHGTITLMHKNVLGVSDKSEFSNTKVYTVTPADHATTGVWDVMSDGSRLSITAFSGNAVDPTNANQQFAFLTANGEYFLYSYGAKKFVVNNGGQLLTDELSENCLVTFLPSTIASNQKIYPIVVLVGGSQLHSTYQNHLSAEGGIITTWQHTESGGNALSIIPVADVDLSEVVAKIETYQITREKAKLSTLISEANTHTGKSYLGEVTLAALNSAINAAQNVVDNGSATYAQVTEQIVNLTAVINDVPYINTVEEFSNNAIYTFVAKRNETSYMMFDPETPDYVASKFMKTTLEAGNDIENCQWAVYKSPRGYYYLYNLGAQKFMGTQSAANTSIPFSVTPQTTSLTFNVSAVSTHPIMFSTDGGNGAANHTSESFDEKNKAGLINWAGGFGFTADDGNVHKVTIVGAIDDATLTAIQEKVEAYENVVLLPAWKEALLASLGYVGGYPLSKQEAIEAVSTLSEATAFENENENEKIQLTAGYYFLKGTGVGNDATWYVTYGDNGTDFVAKALADGEKLSAKHVWSLDEISGEEGYKLRSTNLAKYAQTAEAPATSQIVSEYQNGYKYTFTDNGQAKFTIRDGNGNVLRTEGSGELNQWWGETNETWYIIPAVELDVTLGADYGTIHLPFDVTLPDGLKAYAVTAVSDSYVTLTGKEDIPANKGAILQGEGSHTLTIATASSDWNENQLLGSNVNTYVEGPAYVLGIVDNEIGLYKAALNKDGVGADGETHFLNNANKAYLQAPAGQSHVKAFYFNFGGESTGIETLVPATDVNAPIYDLSGRRVLSTVKGGVYIQNGKKFIVK